MGSGGGSGYFDGAKAGDVKKFLESSTQQTDQAFETAEISEYIKDLLSQANDRDSDAIGVHLDEILKKINSLIEGNISLKFGGSISKHTYVDGLSDVDCLAILNGTELHGKSPEEVKAFLSDAIKSRFPRTEVIQGNLAVTVKFSNAEIQILPSLMSGKNVLIPSPDGQSWSRINPATFSQKLTEINAATGNKAIPTIKLAKALINTTFPDGMQISGYHAESIAVEAFKDYGGPFTHRDLLKHYFKRGAEIVKSPISDRTGQSIHVDEYLGSSNSAERLALSDWFQRTARKMAVADAKSSVESWKRIFGDS